MPVNKLIRGTREFWTHDRSFTALLIYLATSLFLWIPLSGELWFEWIIHDVLYILIIISGIYSVITRWRRQILFVLLGVAAVAMRSFWKLFSDQWIEVLKDLTTIVFFSMLCWFVFRLIFRRGPINLYRIQGAVVVYMIVGIIWANLYHLIAQFFPGSFSCTSYFVNCEIVFSDCLYFSFVVLTTLGLGDIVPTHPLTKSLVIFEGMLGMLYPVIMIARLVSIEVVNKHQKRNFS